MKCFGCAVTGVLTVILFVVLVSGVILSIFASLGYSSQPGGNPMISGSQGGSSNLVTQAARVMAAQLLDCRGMTSPLALNNGCSGAYAHYAALAPAFPQPLLQWGRTHCGGACAAWENGNFQCVSLVLAAYAFSPHPLDFSGNGNQFWGLYTSAQAHQLGYQTIATGAGLPRAPGDIMAWSGGHFGHVSIVLSWQAPSKQRPGKIVFASANTWKPIEELPLLSNLQVDTQHSPYWGAYHVQGYIHPSWLTAGPVPQVDAGKLPNSPYVAVARDAALVVGIDVPIFLRLINQESGFRPDAVSSAGAVGIAQLLPSTAAGLGVNPRDPTSALYGGARLLAGHLRTYGGDYAKALAAYNAGSDRVNSAVTRCGATWRTCLPAETQHYIQVILNEKE